MYELSRRNSSPVPSLTQQRCIFSVFSTTDGQPAQSSHAVIAPCPANQVCSFTARWSRDISAPRLHHGIGQVGEPAAELGINYWTCQRTPSGPPAHEMHTFVSVLSGLHHERRGKEMRLSQRTHTTHTYTPRLHKQAVLPLSPLWLLPLMFPFKRRLLPSRPATTNIFTSTL